MIEGLKSQNKRKKFLRRPLLKKVEAEAVAEEGATEEVEAEAVAEEGAAEEVEAEAVAEEAAAEEVLKKGGCCRGGCY